MLLIGMLTSTFNIQPTKAEPTTIIVPDDYPTIQEAIDHANEGDTIYVKAGIYCENVVVNKTLSLIGQDRVTTIIDGNGTGTVIYVKANKTAISGFTIRDSGLDWHNRSIHLDRSFNSSVSGNNVNNNFFGIWVSESCSNTINSNDVSNNQLGIGLDCPYNNILRNNSITDNGANFGVSGLSLARAPGDSKVLPSYFPRLRYMFM